MSLFESTTPSPRDTRSFQTQGRTPTPQSHIRRGRTRCHELSYQRRGRTSQGRTQTAKSTARESTHCKEKTESSQSHSRWASRTKHTHQERTARTRTRTPRPQCTRYTGRRQWG